MKRMVILIMFFSIVICSCAKEGDKKNDSVPDSNDFQADEPLPENEIPSDQLSGMADWNDIKIVNKVYYPKFQEGTVVQNDRYIFYPDSGNRIMRIDKQTREKKCILELEETAEKGAGALICTAEDGLMVEYECDIFRCDFDGDKKEKIIGNVDVKKKISSVFHESVKNESSIMSDIQFYNGNLYLFSERDCIWKLDPDHKRFTMIAEDAQAACFNKNNLYYVGSSCRYIYRLDLGTGKKDIIKGKPGTGSDSQVFYTEVLEVDNQIYYVRNQEGKKSSLHLYCQGGKDEKLLTFQGSRWADHVDSTRVFFENREFVSQKTYLQVYDVKSRRAVTMEMPYAYQTAAFIAGDVLFYSNRDSKNRYLFTFVIPEEGWD